MPKLTKRVVDGAEIRASDYFLWDDEMPGFGLRVLPSGRKAWVVQYRIGGRGGRTRRVAFGYAGVMTPDEARREARDLLAKAGKGGDPAAAIETHRRAPTLASLCERFMAEHVEKRCKPSTQGEYRRSIDLFIKPKLGTHKVIDIKRPDIAELHHSMRHIPYQANRTFGVLSKLFNLAEMWGLRPDGSNPCRHVRKYPEQKRERFLSPEELQRLGTALDAAERDRSESPHVIAAFRLLVLTGCRLGEIQTLQWAHVRKGRLMLPDSKTGAKTVYLGPAASAVLDALPRVGDNPYVIAGEKPGAYWTDLQRPWRRIRANAKLPGLRIHDLRHSFASSAVTNGEGLSMIGKLLGHSQVQTTARYAHLADDPVRAAADRISDTIAEHFMGKRKTDAAA